MANKIYGRVKITVAGMLLNTVRGASLDPGGIKRTPVTGSNSADGYSEELVPSKLECEVLVDASVSLVALGALVGVTALVQFDTGQTYLMAGAYTTDPVPATEGEGKAKLIMQGRPAVEI